MNIKGLRGKLGKLIEEGITLQKQFAEFKERHLGTSVFGHGIDAINSRYIQWHAECFNLLSLIDAEDTVWRAHFKKFGCDHWLVQIGMLKAMASAIDDGLLLSIEAIVRAEAFADLLEQSEYLLNEGFHVAAGVLGRAVLEEHLRKWCDKENCMPAKPRPMLNDLATALYKNKHFDKIVLLNVQALAAIGNAAAHADPVKREDVEKLLRDVREFLGKNPLS